jgi:hypothetical protein
MIWFGVLSVHEDRYGLKRKMMAMTTGPIWRMKKIPRYRSFTRRIFNSHDEVWTADWIRRGDGKSSSREGEMGVLRFLCASEGRVWLFVIGALPPAYLFVGDMYYQQDTDCFKGIGSRTRDTAGNGVFIWAK